MIERLDSPAGGHLYRMANQQDALAVPGATTIIDATLVEHESLTNWRRRNDARYGFQARATAHSDEEAVDAALSMSDRYQEILRDAGSMAHEEVGAWLTGVMAGTNVSLGSPSISLWAAAAANVVAELDLEHWQVEVTGIRLPHYGGTIDLIGWDSKGVCHIVDWKTTDNDYLAPAYYGEALQIAAYSGLQIDVGGDLGLVAIDPVRGHVARINAAGQACLCEVDIDALWPKWVRLLEDYEVGAQQAPRWFIKRTRRLP